MDYNARYYSPVLGRFISPDSLVPDPTSSGGFNRYRYARNNPLNLVDPTGHYTVDPDTGECFGGDCDDFWDEPSSPPPGSDNILDYPVGFFMNVIQAIGLASRGEENAFLGPNVTNALANDPAMVNYQNSLISIIQADPRYGNENFDMTFEFLTPKQRQVGFGGVRPEGSVIKQFFTIPGTLLDIASNELTLLVRNATLNSSASANVDGTITFNHEFTDHLDLKPGQSRSFEYSTLYVTPLGAVYHGALGIPPIDINAQWQAVVEPQ